MFSYEILHMDAPVLADQQKPLFISSAQTLVNIYILIIYRETSHLWIQAHLKIVYVSNLNLPYFNL